MASTVVSIQSGSHRERVLRRRDELVESHLDLVRQIASSIAPSLPARFELDDLIGAGNVGLLKAATNYDPRRHNGTPFSAYARPVIRGAILDSVRREAWNWVDSTRTNVTEVPERSETPDLEGLLDLGRRIERVKRAVDGLGERHRDVIGGYYNEELRLPAVGERLGVGASRASQLHREAIRELRLELVTS